MADPNAPSEPPASAAEGTTAVPVEEIGVNPVIYEEEEDDGDSAFGDSGSSTASISSMILEYRKLHGRTYHNFKDVEYWGPNDERQNDGLDIHHHLLYVAFDNRLFLSPLQKQNVHKVLDVGTGTGIWAIDFADEFPVAEVIGIDLSPTQPAWTPPNCKFELDDASQVWTFPDNTFDYIHIRFMLGCFKDWTQVYKECFRCLKPGGWLEHQDYSVHLYSDDNSVPPDSIWSEWAKVIIAAGDRIDQTVEVIDKNNFVNWMMDSGFDDVQTKRIKMPMGGWSADKKWKEVGQFNRLSFDTNLEGYALYLLTKVMGWEYIEVQAFLGKIRAAMRNKDYHAYTYVGTAWAQKPAT